MANEENLVNLKNRSQRERKEIARMGAIASNKKQKEKKTMKEQAKLLLSLSVQNPKLKKAMENLGIKESEQTNQMAMIIAMMNKAISKGDVQAFNSLQATIGEKPKEEIEITDMTNKKFDEICKQVGGDGLDE